MVTQAMAEGNEPQEHSSAFSVLCFVSGAVVRAVSAQSTTVFRLLIFDCRLSSIFAAKSKSGHQERQNCPDVCLKSRKDKQNVCRQFWHGDVAVFAPTCLWCCSSWTGLKAELKQFHFIMCSQRFVPSPKCSRSPQRGQQGTILLRSRVCLLVSNMQGGGKVCKETHGHHLNYFLFSFFFFPGGW